LGLPKQPFFVYIFSINFVWEVILLQKINGLTDREQAFLMLISGLLLALGAIVIPSDLPYHETIGIALALLGAVGLALKEWAGGAISASQATLESIAAAMNSLTQLQEVQQKPQTQPVIDKAKLAADLAQMAMETVEKALAAPALTQTAPAANGPPTPTAQVSSSRDNFGGKLGCKNCTSEDQVALF
jgi:hypothetical protein